jgi:hypothetical protein
VRARLAIPFVLIAATAQADEAVWRNWFVGPNTGGGNHPMTVDEESEASAVSAGVTGTDQNGDEIRLGIHCYSKVTQDNWPVVSSTIFVGGMLDDVKKAPIDLLAAFDGGQPVDLGEFLFNQGALVASLRPQVVALLSTHKEMKLSSPNGEVSATLSLENAGTAISNVQCWGDELK